MTLPLSKPALRNSQFFPPNRCVQPCMYDAHLLSRPILDLDFTLREQPLPNIINFVRATPATYFDVNGVMRTAASGVARVNAHVFDGTNWINRGFLREEAATTLNLYSDEQDNIGGWANSWGGGVIITANNAVAPDGTMTADKIVSDDANGDSNQTQAITLATNTVHMVSLFAQNIDSAETRIRIWDDIGTDFQGDLEVTWTDGVPSTDTSTDANNIKYADVGNGWWRISFSFTSDAVNTVHHIVIAPANTGTLGTGINIWRVNLTPGSVLHSPIKAEGSSVTCDADVATIALSDIPGFSQSEGTIYFEGMMPFIIEVAGSPSQMFFVIDDGGITDRIFMFHDDRPAIRTVNSGGNDGIIDGADSDTPSEGAGFKAAAAFAQDDMAFYFDGLLMGTDSTLDLPLTDDLTTIRLGFDTAGNSLNGYISRIALWNRRFPGAVLGVLTA